MKQLTDEDPAMTQTRDADSSRPKPHAQQRASQTIPSTASKPGGFSVAMRHIDAEILAGPVSYTHLTLPTNREV